MNRWLFRGAGGALGLFLLGCIAVVFSGLSDNLHSADLGVVLGNKVNPDGKPSVMLQARLDHAAQLYRQGYFKLVLVSGGQGREGYNEPSVMHDMLVKEGVPSDAIFEDDGGTTTWRTAEDTERFLREHRLQSVLIVSQYFHMPRCRLAFARNGIKNVYWSHSPFWSVRDFFSVPREVFGFAEYLIRPSGPGLAPG